MSTESLNALAKASSAYLRSAMHQPCSGENGAKSVCRGTERRQAHPARHWRGLVPLVPRHGSRIV